MFGIVPKPLWERRNPADGRNRILLSMRCLLVEHDRGLVLIDTGLGNKENEKLREIYGIENSGRNGRTWLEEGLGSLGYTTHDVRWVINTHLHFDHAGGNTFREADGVVCPTFARATYVVQRGELAWATHTNERTSASYHAHNWEALERAGQLTLFDGDGELLPWVQGRLSPGHTPYHQSIVIDGGNGEVACFLGDVCPTSSHLPLPWIMGYDVEPLRTLESKRGLIADARREGWLLVFVHDPTIAWGRLDAEGKGLLPED
jgi:glyoxylase-like metal-dependent hydrolase (beta-lactamase superfamily II)